VLKIDFGDEENNRRIHDRLKHYRPEDEIPPKDPKRSWESIMRDPEDHEGQFTVEDNGVRHDAREGTTLAALKELYRLYPDLANAYKASQVWLTGEKDSPPDPIFEEIYKDQIEEHGPLVPIANVITIDSTLIVEMSWETPNESTKGMRFIPVVVVGDYVRPANRLIPQKS
jgi:hypothetical protein